MTRPASTESASRAGGVAGLLAAAAWLGAMALYATALAPSGYGRPEADPTQVTAFMATHPGLMLAFNLVVYAASATCLVILALALFDRQREKTPLLARAGLAFGLIWAGLLFAACMVANVTLGAVVPLAGEDPARAAETWRLMRLVEEGLGGGNELLGALWVLCLSLAGLRARALPRGLALLGLVIVASGFASLVPAMGSRPGEVFGLAFIVWFAWTGFVLLGVAVRRRR